MGGLGPGIGGFEIVVIGLVALLVVGPKDLPVLMRRVGQMVAKARGMANEFRASFDEMARQSELDDLRKEVEALRSGQGMYPLGKEAEDAFKDIKADMDKPLLDAPAPTLAPTPALEAPARPADSLTAAPAQPKAAKTPAKRATTAKPKTASAKAASKTTSKSATAKPARTPAAKPKVTRKKALDL